MKKIIIAVCLLVACTTQANAAQAYLQSCTNGTSVTGQFIYIGTYNYAGNIFERSFQSWCPQMITVY